MPAGARLLGVGDSQPKKQIETEAMESVMNMTEEMLMLPNGCELGAYNNPDLYESCSETCISAGDTALMMFATTFVMLQTPAMGIAQAGSIKRKNALSMLMQTLTGTVYLATFMCEVTYSKANYTKTTNKCSPFTYTIGMIIGSVLWFVIGMSLTFGESQGGFIGWASDFFFLHNVPLNGCLAAAPTLPSMVWIAFQMMFALMVPVIVTGAWAEKMTFNAFLIFTTAWPILVYYPLAHWVWGGGFLSEWGVLDFAGGITIHSASGAAAFVVSLMITRRRRDELLDHHNYPLMIVGGVLIWAGWYSFNGGSAFAATAQAATALMNTHISACTSGFTWVLLMYFKEKPHHWHLTEIMSGALAGLAGITPGSGFVDPWAAFCIGIIVGVLSWLSVRLFKDKMRLDDVLDVTSLQGVPGATGSILLGLFANPVVGGQAGVFFQEGSEGAEFLGKQIVASLLALVWSAFFTFLLMLAIKFTVGIDIDAQVEEKGLDLEQIGEQAYDDTLDLQLDLGKELTQTLLCEAAASGSVFEVENLIRRGASPTSADYDGRTPAHIAAACGKYGVLKFLIETYHVDVNAKDNFGGTPLNDALEGKHKRVAKLLRDHGAVADEDALVIALLDATAERNKDDVKRYIEAGVPVTGSDYDNRTPLHIACAAGDRELIELLVEAGAPLDALDRWGRTPADDCHFFNHDELAELVSGTGKKKKKKAGADEEAAEETAHHTKTFVIEVCNAAGHGDLSEVKRLVKRKADAAVGDYDKRSPLHLAAMHGHTKVVKYLLTLKGINVNAMDRWKRTPLMEAMRHHQSECVRLLKAAGASVVNEAVGSKLCHAAAKGDLQKLKEMHEEGADLTLVDYDGRSALHLAASNGHLKVVQYLIANGARPDATDRLGNTPLSDAQRHGHKKVVERLQKAMNSTPNPVTEGEPVTSDGEGVIGDGEGVTSDGEGDGKKSKKKSKKKKQ